MTYHEFVLYGKFAKTAKDGTSSGRNYRLTPKTRRL